MVERAAINRTKSTTNSNGVSLFVVLHFTYLFLGSCNALKISNINRTNCDTGTHKALLFLWETREQEVWNIYLCCIRVQDQKYQQRSLWSALNLFAPSCFRYSNFFILFMCNMSWYICCIYYGLICNRKYARTQEEVFHFAFCVMSCWSFA